MDIGIHVSLWTPEWNSPFCNYIYKARDLGFNIVEIPIMNPLSFPMEEVKQALKETGLKVSCGTGLSTTTDISSTETLVSSEGRDHLFRCIDIAAELGSKSLQGVIHSAWGLRTPVSEENRKSSGSILKQASRRAAGLDIKLAMECINRYESSFLNTVDQGLNMIERIAEDNIGLHLDTYHMNIEENSFNEAFETAGSKLYHLHLSENQRGFPGSGHIDWETLILSAKGTGYTGPWVIESYIYPKYPTASDVCIWRPIEKNPGKSITESLKMLREII